MQRIDVNAPLSKPHFILIYGASGTGKTHLAGTAGELGSTLVVDIDTGYDTLSIAKKLHKARENITAVTFDVFKDLDKLYKLVKANDPVKWNQVLGEGVCKAPYEWIVYDTWSELQYYMMEQLRKDRDRGPFTGSLEFRKNVEIQDWQAMTDLNKLAIEELRKCPVNQIFTMQEGYKEDPKTKDLHWGPAIHGKLVQEIPTYFSIVVHTATTTIGGFTATTKSKGRWPAKTRRGEGKDFTDPTIKEVISK